MFVFNMLVKIEKYQLNSKSTIFLRRNNSTAKYKNKTKIFSFVLERNQITKIIQTKSAKLVVNIY